jgi:hypothetical protein
MKTCIPSLSRPLADEDDDDAAILRNADAQLLVGNVSPLRKPDSLEMYMAKCNKKI